MNTIFIFGFFPFYCLELHYGLIYFELNRVIRLKTESVMAGDRSDSYRQVIDLIGLLIHIKVVVISYIDIEWINKLITTLRI